MKTKKTVTVKKEVILLNLLDFLHSDMENVIEIMNQYGRPDKAAELAGAAGIVAEWIEEIKKEGK